MTKRAGDCYTEAILMAMNRSSGEGFWSNWPFAEFLRYWDFRPNTSWFQDFITINNNAGDVGPEAAVLKEVGSYGYQLSRIIDAVQVIVDQLEKSPGLGDLSTDQQQSLAKLRQLAKDVDASMNGYWMRRG
jgi:hypothetical protein